MSSAHGSGAEGPSAGPSPGALHRLSGLVRSTRKRVLVLICAVAALFAYSVAAEGVAGIVTFVVGMVLIPVFWMCVWHLKLKKIKVFQDIASVLLQLEEKKEKSRPGKTKVIRVD